MCSSILLNRSRVQWFVDGTAEGGGSHFLKQIPFLSSAKDAVGNYLSRIDNSSSLVCAVSSVMQIRVARPKYVALSYDLKATNRIQTREMCCAVALVGL
jgi:hypothetical protein